MHYCLRQNYALVYQRGKIYKQMEDDHLHFEIMAKVHLSPFTLLFHWGNPFGSHGTHHRCILRQRNISGKEINKIQMINCSRINGNRFINYLLNNCNYLVWLLYQKDKKKSIVNQKLNILLLIKLSFITLLMFLIRINVVFFSFRIQCL